MHDLIGVVPDGMDGEVGAVRMFGYYSVYEDTLSEIEPFDSGMLKVSDCTRSITSGSVIRRVFLSYFSMAARAADDSDVSPILRSKVLPHCPFRSARVR